MQNEPYGVLKGHPVAFRSERHATTPHAQILIEAKGVQYRAAVNVYSRTQPSDLLFFVDENFRHPITKQLAALKPDWYTLPNEPDGLALDYVRSHLLERKQMKVLPPHLDGPRNDLNDFLQSYIHRAINADHAHVYAFGRRWGPDSYADVVYGFKPGNGVHDIHMNQGNVLKHRADDGPWQDGALLISYERDTKWIALFLAFQSQSWHTHPKTGHSLVDNG